MKTCSLSRRKIVFGGLIAGGAGIVLTACGKNNPLAPDKPAAKPVSVTGVARRLQVKQAFTVSSSRPISPLEALRTSGRSYQTAVMTEGLFVTSVSGANEPWVFLVDNIMPDSSGTSLLTRLGKVGINSVSDAHGYLPRFRAGTIGLSLATDNQIVRSPPTVETVFAPSYRQNQVLITWLQVGLLQPDTV